MPTLVLRPFIGKNSSGTDIGNKSFDGDANTFDQIHAQKSGRTSKTSTVTLQCVTSNSYWFNTSSIKSDGIIDDIRLICDGQGSHGASSGATTQSGYTTVGLVVHNGPNSLITIGAISMPSVRSVKQSSPTQYNGKSLSLLLNDISHCNAQVYSTAKFKKGTIRTVLVSANINLYEIRLEIDYHVPIKLTKNDNQVNTFSKTKVNNNWVDIISGYTKKNGIWVPLTD